MFNLKIIVLTLSDIFHTQKAFPFGVLLGRASVPFPLWRRCKRTRNKLKCACFHKN